MRLQFIRPSYVVPQRKAQIVTVRKIRNRDSLKRGIKKTFTEFS